MLPYIPQLLLACDSIMNGLYIAVLSVELNSGTMKDCCCLVLLVAVTSICISVVQGQLLTLVIHVDSSNESLPQDCWKDDVKYCQDLNSALGGMQEAAATQPVSVVVHPGDYQLHSNITITDVTNTVSILGLTERVVVKCTQESGLIFISSNNVVIYNMQFTGCSTLQSLLKENLNIEIVSSLSFHNCLRVTLTSVNVSDTKGIGVFFYDTIGGVATIEHSSFTNNTPSPGKYLPAGGLVIVLNMSLPSGPSWWGIQDNEDFNYMIHNCIFEGNYALEIDDFDERYHNVPMVGQGGGMATYFLDNTANITIIVEQCIFKENCAQQGGGLFANFTKYVHGNNLLVNDCQFITNNYINDYQHIIPFSQGGGAYVLLASEYGPSNTVNFNKCNFSWNIALIGAGCSLTSDHNLNYVIIDDSNFDNNIGYLGAAVYMYSPQITAIETTSRLHIISNCTFQNNLAANFSQRPELTKRVGFGIVYIKKAHVHFFRNIVFSNNKGTALAVADSTVSVKVDTTMRFTENTGMKGGAIMFMDNGHLKIYPQTVITFDSNTAQGYGGAIYAGINEAYDFSSRHQCFFTYNDSSVHPDEWNTTIIFSGNRASQSNNSIWCTSLEQCLWQSENINKTFCWKSWKYDDSTCDEQVMTDATRIEQVANGSIYSGLYTTLPITIYDDLGHNITNRVTLAVSVIKGEGGTEYNNFHISADSLFFIYGKQDTTLTVNLQTPGITALTKDIEMKVLPCPPGSVSKAYDLPHSPKPSTSTPRCTCIDNHKQVLLCSEKDNNFTVYLRPGFGMSYENKTVFIGATPYSNLVNGTLPHNVHELDDFMCGELNRTGLLCGKCRDGLTRTIIRPGDYHCINCTTHPILSWMYVLVAQQLPTTILYLIVILFDINAASSFWNGFIFYCQVTTFVVTNYQFTKVYYSPLDVPESKVASLYEFLESYPYLIIPYTLWNLDFMTFQIIGQHSMCLMRNGSAMAYLSLRYLVSAYPLVLVAITYVLVELHAHNCRPIVWLWKPFRVCFLRFKRTWNPRHCIINAFVTFIIISYVQFLFTSVQLLSATNLWDTYHNTNQLVFYYDASVPLFGPEHRPYAILAIFVLIVFVATPPVILLLYPLKVTQMILNKCTCINLQLFRMIMETFQGAFKDGTQGTRDYRYFAGLYLVFRILLIVFNAMIHVPVLYLVLIVFYVLVTPLFALLRPYRQDVYNYVDTGIFVIMSLLKLLQFFNYHTLIIGQELTVAVSLPFVLYFTPLLCFLVASIYWMVVKLIKRRHREITTVTSDSAGFPDRILYPSRYRNRTIQGNINTVNQQEQQANAGGVQKYGSTSITSQKVKFVEDELQLLIGEDS